MRRNTVLLWLLIVFVSGTAVGVAGYRYFSPANSAREDRKPPSREQLRQEYRAKLRERVGLSEEQLTQITTILDEAKNVSDGKRNAFEADIREVQNQARERIRQVMTPEQRERYEAWRAERKREREKHDRDRGRQK